MNESKVNIFLPITKYSMAVSERVIVQYKLINDFNILLNPHGLNYTRDLWSDVFSDNIERKFHFNLFQKIYENVSYVYRLSRFYKKVSPLYKIYLTNHLNFYYVDFYHVLTNHIFSTNNFINSYVIEDGLLNYYDNEKTKLRFTNLKDFFYRSFFGLSYNSISTKTHLTGVFLDNVKCQYVSSPEYAIASHKSKKVEIFEKLSNSDINSKNVLILGQEPYIALFGINKYLFFMKQMARFITSQPNTNLYYKAHPRAEKDHIKAIYTTLKPNFKSLCIVDNHLIVEQMIKELKPSRVISFDSTSLINIRKMNDTIEIYSYLPQEKKNSNEVILDLFKKFNITVNESL